MWVFVLVASLAVRPHALAAEASPSATTLGRCAHSPGVHTPLEVCERHKAFEPGNASTTSLAAELVWVMDGDSLRARIAGELVEVRLADIDAPEYGQPYAWEAKLALIDLVRAQRLTLVPREVDRHGRIVARVWAGEMDLSRELVSQGAAWFYPAYAKNPTLREHEQRARIANRGLWGLEGSRVAPWVWRKQQSRSIDQSDASPSDDERRATKR